MQTQRPSYLAWIGLLACTGCGGPVPTGGGAGGNNGADAVPNAFAALSAGEYKKVPQIIKAVDARAARVPDDGYAHYYSMTMREWLVSEAMFQGAVGLEALLEVPAAIEHGERAYAL